MGLSKAGRPVLVLVLGSLLACDGGAGEPPDVGLDGPAKPDAAAAVTIGPAGGTFSFFGGKLKLEVPPGALAKDTPIEALVPKSYPAAAQLVPGAVYDLLPDGTKFAKVVKLSITYDQGKVPKGTTEASLRLHKVVGGAWALVSGGGVDTKGNVAWTKINSFSKYGVKGPSPTTVDGMIDTGVDASVPVDAKPDAPDGPQPDAPITDAPTPDMSADFVFQCVGQPKGSPCNDGKACTKDDACDGKGACAGTSYFCKAAGQCETSRICDGKGGCLIAYKLKGAVCDDKVPCTKLDFCDGKGTCKGVPYSCKPTAQCEASSTCDGKGGCTMAYKANGVTCDDKKYCTKGDACDGKGACMGTSYACNPGQCESSSACDGKGGCQGIYKANGATCDDKTSCTKGDACDGKGACVGTSYACSPGQCELSSTCDGKGGCTATYKTTGAT